MAHAMKQILQIPAWLTLVAIAFTAGPAYSGREHQPMPREEASQWHSADHSRVRLIRGGLAGERRDLTALIIEINEGWHTYWRSPGILGLPPTFNWEGSENVLGVDVRWPVPEHIEQGDYEAYGYFDRLVLPLVVTREDPDMPAWLNLAVGYAVCEDVCTPAIGYVSLRLPGPNYATDYELAYRGWISTALAQVPTRDLNAAGIGIEPVRLELLEQGGRALRLSFISQSQFESPQLILEGPKGMRFGAPELVLSGDGHRLEALVPFERSESSDAPMGTAIVATLSGGARPVEFPLEAIIAAGDLASAP